MPMNGALAGLVILVIGDSHMSHMLTNLHNQLEDDGAAVHSYFMCGATAEDWIYPSQVASWAGCGKGEHHERDPVVLENQKLMPTYQLSALIAKYHPNLVVVQLGDGMGKYGTAQIDRQWIAGQVKVLTGKIAAANIACDWVGPTWGQDRPPFNKTESNVRELAQVLSASVVPCRYIDSTTFARPGEWPTIDGSHLQPDSYRKWSVDIADAIVRLKTAGLASSH
jgi:hypothetical protein